MNSTTKNLIYCALFAALTAVFSQIAIPIEPVPVNLALFSVFVAGGLLGAAKGSISQAVYILLGAVGAPVFSNLHGGFQVLIGPTGGYIAGYVVAALAAGIVAERFGRKTIPVIIGCVIGLAACYTIGMVLLSIRYPVRRGAFALRAALSSRGYHKNSSRGAYRATAV